MTKQTGNSCLLRIPVFWPALFFVFLLLLSRVCAKEMDVDINQLKADGPKHVFYEGADRQDDQVQTEILKVNSRPAGDNNEILQEEQSATPAPAQPLKPVVSESPIPGDAVEQQGEVGSGEESDKDAGMKKDRDNIDPFELFSGSIEEDDGSFGIKDEWKTDENRGKPKINIPLTIFSLLVVCAIAYWALRIYSNYVGSDQGSPAFGKKLMRVRERHMIAPNKQLCLVEIPGKILLISISDNDIKILTEVDPEKIQESEKENTVSTEPQSTPFSYIMTMIKGGSQESNR